MSNMETKTEKWYRHLLTFASLSGFVFSLTILYLVMRAVMDVGGYCAEGGAYAIEVHCPEGVPWKTLLGVFGLFVFGIAYISFLPKGAFNFAYFFWTGLFGALGWNFAEYTIKSYQQGEGSIGWLVCAVLFMLMAAGPLLIILLTGFKIDFFIPDRDVSQIKVVLFICYQLMAIAAGIAAGIMV